MSDCKIINSDAAGALVGMPSRSVHCVVTSPPYWGLRDYGEKGQIGLEEDPQTYIWHIVRLMAIVRRVLRDDGTLWLNIGDSYSAKQVGNAKPKDLVGVPWRVALALQADGWYLRSDIIWSKPNPMPQSVLDRPTSSHEYMFLLTKKPRYFFDSYAVREKGIIPAGTLAAKGSEERFALPGVSSRPPEYKEYDGQRNIRSVWNVATKPFPGAHFATFPPKLIEPCIKAGTSEHGCCPKCLAPWRRVVEREGMSIEETGVESQGRRTGGTPARDTDRRKHLSGTKQAAHKAANPDLFNWVPGCDHGIEPIPCTVLDPFFGSGTTGLVALGMNRSCIGIELNSEYAKMAYDRVNSEHQLFSNVELISAS